MPKWHRQIPTGLPELDEEENKLFRQVDQERLERRHAWKGWLAIVGTIAVSGILVLFIHPLVGIAGFFLMIYLAKDFNPISKDQRYHD